MHGQPQDWKDQKRLIHVMVVDDEAIVRNDIREMIDWNAHGYELAAEAENGRDAMEKVSRESIEIIIADIEMPVMNGLDLAAAVLSGPKPAKFIFLTAYSNFEFARASLRLGIDSYILKHEINEKILLNELERLRAELEKTSQQQMACRNEAMHQLLSSRFPPAECRKILEDNQIPFSEGVSFLLRVETGREKSLENHEKGAFSAVCHALNHKDITECTAFPMDEDSIGALIVVRSEIPPEHWRLCVLNCTNHIQEQLKLFCGAPLFLLVGKRLMGPQELFEEYQRMKRTAEKLYFYPSPCTIFCENENTENRISMDDAFSICRFLEMRQYADAENALNRLFTQTLPAVKDLESFRKILVPITDRFAELWRNEFGSDAGVSPTELYQELIHTDTVFSAYEKLRRMLAEIRAVEKEGQYDRIKQIKAYLEEHYAEDVSLDMLGSFIGVSEAYMSQFFKQQIGVSFKTYLTDIRMKKAADMLLHGGYKIHDIGEKVGYHSTQYFCLVFKQQFGMTPSEFVRRHFDE